MRKSDPIKEEADNGNPSEVRTLATYYNSEWNGVSSSTNTQTRDYHNTLVSQEI